jgi:hypothetical protein
MIATALAPAAIAGQVSVSVSPAYAAGDFGQPEDTRIYYLPVQLHYDQGPWSAAVTVAWLSVQGPVALTSGGVSGAAPVPTERRSGAGDTWIEASYRIRGGGAWPDRVPYFKVKLATADAERGLGSGEHDYEAGLSLEWALGGGWFPFAAGGYRRVGEPDDTRLRDIAVYEAGLSYHLSGRHTLTAMFAGNQSALPDTARAADLVFAWNRAAAAGPGVQLYVGIGLSDGSPDYSAGVSVESRF